ncbi:aldolase/citrate lyase family protein [Pollutimonas bauzanensis]|uniref:HpcH/HpaI aldolase family protein n=1 Tax=Pollutimonas bauzanensis TaxID=658167 RepID=UPI00333E8390
MTNLKKKLSEGHCITIIGNSVANSYASELVASSGFDAVMIDLQHSAIALADVNDLARAVRAQGATPIVRVTSNNAPEITKVLDGGVSAVIAPMVNDAQSCRQFVESCLYSPLGQRSFGPYLGQVIEQKGIEQYYNETTERTLPIAMIETDEGVENAEGIFSVPHLGAVYVGASDLSISLGLGCIPDYSNPALLERVVHLFEIGRKHGVAVGAYAPTLEDTIKLKKLGARLLWVGSDQGFIKEGVIRRTAAYQKALEAF